MPAAAAATATAALRRLLRAAAPPILQQLQPSVGLPRLSQLVDGALTSQQLRGCARRVGASSQYLRTIVGRRKAAVPTSSTRSISSSPILGAEARQQRQEDPSKDVARQEDPFDTITDRIPERPVSVVEGTSYSLVILAGLAVAGGAAYAVVKELILEPKEWVHPCSCHWPVAAKCNAVALFASLAPWYQVFNKALDRVQNDNQVTVRIGHPVTGYGQDSRNRVARQRISHKVWRDEDGVERVQVQFHIRGPRGAGLVHSEMFKDPIDRKFKFTYLIVDIISPQAARLMLESYVPDAPSEQTAALAQ
eukprot:SM000044S16028  [mRNA]  locus=s44:619878:622033:+ [translate_table: standard]